MLVSLCKSLTSFHGCGVWTYVYGLYGPGGGLGDLGLCDISRVCGACGQNSTKSAYALTFVHHLLCDHGARGRGDLGRVCRSCSRVDLKMSDRYGLLVFQ